MIEECTHILKYQPENIEIRMLFGISYYQLQQYSQAKEQFETAQKLALRAAQQSNYEDAEILSTLATVYALNGSFDMAITYAGRAQKLAMGKNAHLSKKIDQQLKSFKSGNIWVEAWAE